MSPAPAQAHISGEDRGGCPWVWALPALAVCFVAISSQSLWIDEAFMARKAAQPTLADWWRMMPEGNGSDLQMPLFMIYLWGFAKIFGLGEWALRAANIPWFAVGATAFISALPKPQRVAVAIATLFSPFAWFYLNEARPYAMQIGCSLAIFAALYRLSGNPNMEPRCERNWIIGFCVGIVALCGSSLLGVIWAGAAFVSLLVLFPIKRLMQLLRAHWLTCSLAAVFLAALAGYYVWTIKFGTQALGAGSPAEGGGAVAAVKSAAHFRRGSAGGTEIQNLAFVGYELLGFSGLGPSRLEIRAEKLHAFRHFAPQLGVYAFAVCAILWLGMRRVYNSPRPVRGMGLVLIALLPAMMLAAAGYFLGFLMLGRHCAPLLAGLLFLLSLGIAAAFSTRNWIFKTCAGTFVLLSVVSCLSLRFARRHEKDDYRDAAKAAIAALHLGQKVWWSASEDGAVYYHLPLANGPDQLGRALLVLNPTAESLAAPAPPDVVIASKADLYDNQGALAKYVSDNPYTQTANFPAFAVWQRKSGENHQ